MLTKQILKLRFSARRTASVATACLCAWPGCALDERGERDITDTDKQRESEIVCCEMQTELARLQLLGLLYPNGYPGTDDRAHFVADRRLRREAVLQLVSRQASETLDLSGANLRDVRLDGINLTGVVLEAADLQGVSLRGATLTGAVLSRADLRGADLSGASLIGATAYSADFSGASLGHAILSNGVYAFSVFDRADLTRADLSSCDLYEASFSETVLRHSSLIGASLVGARFIMADLEYADLRGVGVEGTGFHTVDLRNANFDELEGFSVSIYDSEVGSARFCSVADVIWLLAGNCDDDETLWPWDARCSQRESKPESVAGHRRHAKG